jgi:Na+/H+ antiporter NhaD/arsenite permease-like protein
MTDGWGPDKTYGDRGVQKSVDEIIAARFLSIAKVPVGDGGSFFLRICRHFASPALFDGARRPMKSVADRRLVGLFLAGMFVVSSATSATAQGISAASSSIDFTLFALTLAGIGIFHRYSLQVALTGLAAITLKKLLVTGFREGPGFAGLLAHIGHEWVVLANLFLLLCGFALLARHFENSRVPDLMPRVIPHDWTGGLVLLGTIFVTSSFLDNIAAAMIGATVASHVYRGRVRVGYLAAIVAASNAGGAGSVIGDTTTTMLWIGGVRPSLIFHAYIAAGIALLVCGIPASIAQQRYSPIVKHVSSRLHISIRHLIAVVIILGAAIGANVGANMWAPDILDRLPAIGLAVAVAIFLTIPLAQPDWTMLPSALRSAVFLLSLVAAASMMPVESMPSPTWPTTFGLGFVSAVFDNIPLTALALSQGGYDWGFLAYAVGFGGSMIWFGSSAGVAVASLRPEAKSASRWIAEGWPVILAYVAGFSVMLAVMGWNPQH